MRTNLKILLVSTIAMIGTFLLVFVFGLYANLALGLIGLAIGLNLTVIIKMAVSSEVRNDKPKEEVEYRLR